LNIQVRQYTVRSRKLHTPLRLVFLSDLHSREYGTDNEELLSLIAGEKPDLILSGGDMMIARDGDDRTALHLLTRLPEIARTYASNGNHEQYMADEKAEQYKTGLDLLQTAGVSVLENEADEVNVRGNALQITGLCLPLYLYRRFKKPSLPADALRSLIPPSKDSCFSILLAHNPQFMKAYLEFGSDLVLSGHFHGGIFRFGRHGVLISPYGFPFPAYGYGQYTRNGRTGIVTSGLGEHVIPVRIHNPFELVTVTLIPETR
jgi:predicted MPP superfamily phosphohydrolase